jgi:Trypsin-co-occurring domain 2
MTPAERAVRVTDAGVPVPALITMVKEAVRRAGVSRSAGEGDLRVESVQLVLQALASKTAGGELDFRIPFIGMKLRAGAKVTRRDTHTIDMTLMPPAQPARTVRGGTVEDALVDAIVTIRTTMAHASAGDDPWILSTGTVDISFGVTRTGSISLGTNGELADEVTHTLRLRLIPASADTS